MKPFCIFNILHCPETSESIRAFGIQSYARTSKKEKNLPYNLPVFLSKQTIYFYNSDERRQSCAIANIQPLALWKIFENSHNIDSVFIYLYIPICKFKTLLKTKQFYILHEDIACFYCEIVLTSESLSHKFADEMLKPWKKSLFLTRICSFIQLFYW